MNKTKIKKLEELLSSPKKIIIIPHKNPDGDALGSCLALMHFLNFKSHNSTIISPNNYPNFLKWLPGEKSIIKFSEQEKLAKTIIKESSLIFVLDFNDLNRIGDLNKIIENSKSKKIMIDHHEKPKNFADLESFPGVGHKTASVIMSQAFGVPAFAVDTHVHRLMYRWGLSSGKSVKETERDAKRLFPKEKWSKLHLQIIFYGRDYCPAKKFNPNKCPITSVVGRRSLFK